MSARSKPEAIINGTVVRQRRKALGYTQVTLAIAAACSARTIAMIERGQRIDPPTSVALRLAKTLSVTVEALCRGSEPYRAPSIATSPYAGLNDPESDE